MIQMVTDMEKLAPYAPLAPLVALIRRRREKGLPEVLNSEKLAQLGISEGNISRILQALRFLNLIDEEGHQTEWFFRVARAKEQEYQGILAEIIKGAYHDVFTIIDDPNQATDIELNDAFRFYQPQSQRSRMILLFRGLCQEAGLIAGGPPTARKRTRTTTPSKPSSSSSSSGAKKVQPKEAFQSEPYQTPSQQASQPVSNQDFALVRGLIDELPREKQWTKQDREKWFNAVTAMVDWLIKVVDPVPEEDMYSQ